MAEILPETLEKSVDLLIKDEGLRLHPYRDTVGKLTIGIGRNLDDVGISKDEAIYLCKNDVNESYADLAKLSFFESLSEPRKIALINMRFNIGLPRLMQFRKMIDALEKHDYVNAAKEMLDSEWSKQVGHRAERLAYIIETGQL